MGILAGRVDHVIGVDTHRDRHTAAICDPNGGVEHEASVCADAAGYRALLDVARERAAGRRVWAIEGSGMYGAGLAHYLLGEGEWVVEIDRPARPARRNGAKSDALDAARAAREALGREHLGVPRARGSREAIRALVSTREGAVGARTQAMCQLRALVVGAPEPLRQRLRVRSSAELLQACCGLRVAPSQPIEQQATIVAARALARRILALEGEVAELESRLTGLVRAVAPQLVDEPGVGPVCAAWIIVAWSHRGRLRSEAAFAQLAGACPIPASSGQVVRHRLNRSGDRRLNRALHTVVLCRLALDPQTRAYAARRAAEGKSRREIKRCLKRFVARRVFRLLECGPPDAARELRSTRTSFRVSEFANSALEHGPLRPAAEIVCELIDRLQPSEERAPSLS